MPAYSAVRRNIVDALRKRWPEMAVPLKYNLRSLLVRRISTAMTAGGIALVVAVFVIVMAMVAGLGSAITNTGTPDTLVVLRRGATTETYSAMSLAQFDALKFLPQIRRDAQGNPMASPELPVQTLLGSAEAEGSDNVVFRGVLPVALAVHDQIHLIAGRMFRPGLNEVMVGAGLVNRYKDCALGATLGFGRGTWKVVGIFAAGGSSFESEVWGDIHNVQDEARRGAYYACARLKADSEAQTSGRGADAAHRRRSPNQPPGADRRVTTTRTRLWSHASCAL